MNTAWALIMAYKHYLYRDHSLLAGKLLLEGPVTILPTLHGELQFCGCYVLLKE